MPLTIFIFKLEMLEASASIAKINIFYSLIQILCVS